MESGGDAQRGAHQENISGQTGISIPVGPLSESSRKLLNRVVPNGTLRGVEGEAKTSPIRLSAESQKQGLCPVFAAFTDFS